MAYWKYRVADWLLCAGITVSLVFTVCSGFVLEDPWSSSPAVVLGASLLLQGLLVLLSYNRATVCLGALTGAALAFLAAAYIRTFHPMTDETANSVFLYVLIQILVVLVVYLLARTKPGLTVLFLLGGIVTAGAHFLEFPAPMWSALLLPPCAGMLYLYRVYLGSLKGAALGRIRNGRYILQTVLLGLAAFLIAGGLFAGVVRQLNPPTQELLLITRLESMDLMERLGVSSVKSVVDTSLSAQTDPEMTEYDNTQSDLPEEEADDTPETETQSQPETPETQETQADATAIRYDLSSWNPLWLLLLLPVAVMAACVGRVLYRRHWRRRLRRLPRQDAVTNYYQYFLSRLGRAGLPRTEYRTLREFVSQEAPQLEPYRVGDVSFADLTGIYERVAYGGGPVSEEEYDRFERFCDRFLRNLRHEFGTLKYYLQVFRF